MLTKRGYFVLYVGLTTIVLAALLGIGYVMFHLWWTPAGICWGDFEKCVPPDYFHPLNGSKS